MPVRARRPVEQRAGLVQQRQIVLAPPEVGGTLRAVAQQQLLLAALEDPLRGLRERRGRGQETGDELVRAHGREHTVDVLHEEAALFQHALELVEAAQREILELLVVALVEAAQHRHAEPLARGTERGIRLEDPVEELGHLPLAHRHEDAVDVEDELFGRRLHREFDRVLHDLSETRVRLEPCNVGRLLALDDDPVEQLGDSTLLDRVLAECREHVRDVVHEHRIRADDGRTGSSRRCRACALRDAGRAPRAGSRRPTHLRPPSRRATRPRCRRSAACRCDTGDAGSRAADPRASPCRTGAPPAPAS